jgi:hypothetical protein
VGDWLKPVIDWVKGSVVPLVAIWIASALFAFTPLSEAVAKYQPWPLVIFVTSTAYLGVLCTATAGKKTIAFIKCRRAKQHSRAGRIDSLHNLSEDEMHVLRLFIGNNRRTIPMDMLHGEMTITANELVDRRILRVRGNFITTRDRAFSIEDWAWEYLNKNPEVLD